MFITSSLADNGGHPKKGASNAPLHGGKGTHYEGGLRVPAFILSPMLSHLTGTTNNEFMHISDWFPTLLHLAGADTTGLTLDGQNMWNVIR